MMVATVIICSVHLAAWGASWNATDSASSCQRQYTAALQNQSTFLGTLMKTPAVP